MADNEQALDPTINRPTSAIPQEWTARFMSANPGAKETDAVKSFMLLPADQQRSWSQPPPPPPTEPSNPVRAAANWFGEHLGNVAGTGAYGIDRLTGPALRALGIPVQSFDSVEQAQEKGRGVAPHSPAGVALTLTNPSSMLRGAALGAGAELAGGGGPGDVAAGAVQGVLPAAVGKTIKGVTSAVKQYAGIGTEEALRDALGQKWAGRLVDEIKTNVPELGSTLSGEGSVPQQLVQLGQGAGRKALGAMLETTENKIASAVPSVKVPIATPSAAAGQALTPQQAAALARMPPAIQAQVMAQAGGQSAAPVAKAVSTKEAFAELQNLKDKAYDLKGEGNLREFRDAMNQVNALQQNILAAIQQVDQKLAAAWTAAIQKYDHGLSYLGLAKAAGTGESAFGSPFNIPAMVKEYLSDPRYGRLPGGGGAGIFQEAPGAVREFIQNLRDRVTGPSPTGRALNELLPSASAPGAELGTQPSITGVHVPFVTHAPTLIPGFNLYSRGPTANFLREPGKTYGINPSPLTTPGLLSLGDMGRRYLPSWMGGSQ